MTTEYCAKPTPLDTKTTLDCGWFRGCECPDGTHVNDIITASGEVRHQHDSTRWLTSTKRG